jgi:predicted Zn-dependent protease
MTIIKIKTIVSSAIIFAQIIACSTVPVTGRKQLNLIPDSELNAMSFEQYEEFISTHTLSEDPVQITKVRHAGIRIRDAVERYFAEKKMSNALNSYRWEFNLVEDSTINAWCMPGGKVVVYTGIMPIAQDEAGLAVIMGHEIAHAVANHGNERMSQGLVAELGGMALAKAIEEKPEQTQNLFFAAYGITAQVGLLLPYSRLHESEADQLGLIFMAMAGYDPNEAVNFWQRMANLSQGGSVPEFLSTHPSDEKRIKKIKELLPEAMKYYKK